MEKVQVKIYIPKNLDTKFRQFLNEKYEKYQQGTLSLEICEAMQYWLSLHTNAQKTLEQRIPNPDTKVKLAYHQVKGELLRFYDEIESGKIIPISQFEKAIMETRGSDERTVKKWRKVFDKMGLTKFINNAVMEIM